MLGVAVAVYVACLTAVTAHGEHELAVELSRFPPREIVSQARDLNTKRRQFLTILKGMAAQPRVADQQIEELFRRYRIWDALDDAQCLTCPARRWAALERLHEAIGDYRYFTGWMPCPYAPLD